MVIKTGTLAWDAGRDLRCGGIDGAESKIVCAVFAGANGFLDAAGRDADDFIIADELAGFVYT